MQEDDPATKALESAFDQSSTLPPRYRAALYKTFDDVMPADWLADAGAWLHNQREHFVRGGDIEGAGRFNYELATVDELYKPLGEMRAKLLGFLDEALPVLEVPEFPLEYVETHATLYHHGSHFTWHTDAPGYDGEPVFTRRVAFCLYMHSTPRMFSGGELEFLDGTAVDAVNNRVVLFHPLQQHRIRRVDCWSADFLHGRWAFFGWIHGPRPGEKPSLCGVPRQG